MVRAYCTELMLNFKKCTYYLPLIFDIPSQILSNPKRFTKRFFLWKTDTVRNRLLLISTFCLFYIVPFIFDRSKSVFHLIGWICSSFRFQMVAGEALCVKQEGSLCCTFCTSIATSPVLVWWNGCINHFPITGLWGTQMETTIQLVSTQVFFQRKRGW